MFEYSWFEEMPEDIRELFIIQYQYYSCKNIDDVFRYVYNSEEFFIMDLSADDRGTVIFEYNKSDTDYKVKNHIDINIDDHPALKDMLENGNKEIYFEQTDDFPIDGSHFIGYQFYPINDDTMLVEGLVYNYDNLRQMVIKTIFRSLFTIIIGIVLILSVLIIFLYRRAVKPVRQMQNALIDYTHDKNSAKVVSKMLRAYVRNELGYLSDVISDLALEIDHYTKEVARSEKELYEAKVQIMVSQIRPHFMYNTLSSIAILCRLDPETAYEAAVTFSDYLRSNMDSLRQTTPVPFTKEFDHLKKYLYIEKLRFEDLLNVEYDIQTTAFEVPMLSIQPLVENAVKHGVGMKDDGRSHVGMENTKKRLKDLCGADIVIESEVGKGTTARVIIPKKKEDRKK